jgi:hypothetical protein
MKTMILLVSLAISAVGATAQNTVRKTSNDACARTSNKSFSARVKNYPFNLAARVLLVSYVGLEPVKTGDTAYVNKGLPRENDSICYSKLKEIKTLTLPQVDQLTDILYNYGYAERRQAGRVYIGTINMCYDPHNAILFISAEGKPLGYIELCFLCSRHEESDGIKLGEMCDQKMNMIKEFFRKAGVDYGVASEPGAEN